MLINNKTALRFPEELKTVLQADKKALQDFNAMPKSHQKQYLEVVLDAKKSETKLRRSKTVAEMVKKWTANKNNPAGYSGKPVWQKLEIKEDQTVIVVNAPDDYAKILNGHPHFNAVDHAKPGAADIAHVFVVEAHLLLECFKSVENSIRDGGCIWISWPKKSSKVETTMDEQVIRDVLLPEGWVDTKVCAVSEIWSGLKMMRRRKK